MSTIPVKGKVLVIDDDTEIRYSLKRVLESQQYEVILAASGEEGVNMAEDEQPSVIICDNRMEGISGIEALQHLRNIAPDSMVILMTAYSTTQTAIEAMKFGAFDYIVKPFELKKILDLVAGALQANQQLVSAKQDALPGIDSNDYVEGIVGSAESMRGVFKRIGQVAASDATVMITGESGTGKELVARSIYRHSHRGSGPFVAVNCAAIPENLIESELFGHEKGSFTGATAQKKGRFELADKGTIFLDEIGDMTLSTQTKVLRVLQEGEVQRVGGTETIKVDVRLLAATNKDLEAMVGEKEFREDLFYRLNVFRLRLPPLRERMEDIPIIASFLLKKLATKSNSSPKQLSPQALDVLKAYKWPGNVRELENTIQHSAVLAQGNVILQSDLPAEIRGNEKASKDDKKIPADKESKETTADNRKSESSSNEPSAPTTVTGDLLGFPMDKASSFDHVYKLLRQENDRGLLMAIEKEIILRALKENKGNQLRASEILGISRSTLRKRIEEFDIET